jgi:hypothetical protein
MILPLTGYDSLIDIMLGQLEMTVDECIGQYRELIGTVFAKSEKSRLRLLPNGVIKSRFSSKTLAKQMQGVIKNAENAPKNPLSTNEPFHLETQDGASWRCRV